MTAPATAQRQHSQQYQLPEPWESAVDDWLTWLTIAGVPPTTRHLRRGHLRWLGRNSGTACPADISTAMLVALFSAQPWSNDHRRSVRRTLVSFFDWSVEHGRADHNPAAALPRVPAGKPCPRPCPDQMWRDLIAAATPRERMMIRLAGEVGMRRAEVARCHRDDLINDGGGWSLIVHGKGGRQRLVPITDRLAGQIQEYAATGFLFPGNENGHLSAHYVGKLIGALMPRGWSMHKLRHRYATRGLAGTGDLLAVRDALGHVSVATTQIYTAVAPGKVRRVSEAAADSDAEL